MAVIPESEARPEWEAMRAACVRSLYSGEIRARRPAQAVGAGAVHRDVVRGRASDNPWPEVASVLAGIVAPANAWAIATDLDQRILTLATLRPASKALRIDCSEIWSSWNADGALSRFAALERRASDLGTLASSRAPWNPGAVAR